MGGAVAALVGAQSPERVERLVLVDAAGFNLRPADRPAMVRLTSHPLAERILAVLPLRRLVVTRGLRQVLHDDSKVTPERIDEYLAAASRPGTLASIRSLGASQRLDPQGFLAVLGRIEAPTLVIWGAEDTWIPVAHADRFVNAISGARKAVLPGVGHTSGRGEARRGGASAPRVPGRRPRLAGEERGIESAVPKARSRRSSVSRSWEQSGRQRSGGASELRS